MHANYRRSHAALLQTGNALIERCYEQAAKMSPGKTKCADQGSQRTWLVPTAVDEPKKTLALRISPHKRGS
jgi:hypothetical protein